MNTQNNHPQLVIGMPVYNGGRYISETIESILNQTFSDFILLISDNASTDQTQHICQEFARKDKRISYRRQDKNLGMAGNFNYVLQPGNAPFFKWAAHDDLIRPNYLEKCIELLKKEPELAIVHSRTERISDNSDSLGFYDDLGLRGLRISERFWRTLWTDNIYEIYGVMRAKYVSHARPVGLFFGSERNLLAEVLLQGNMGYIDEPLFARRDHDSSLTAMHLNAKQQKDFKSMQSAHSTESKLYPYTGLDNGYNSLGRFGGGQ